MALKWAISSAYSIVINHSADAAWTPSKINEFPGDGKKKKQEIINHASLTTDDQYSRINNEKKYSISGFQMPLHYPRYRKADYEKMEEWKLDLLLQEYGLNFHGHNLEEKKKFAMGAFLWPDQI